jgi:hypothetical protein
MDVLPFTALVAGLCLAMCVAAAFLFRRRRRKRRSTWQARQGEAKRKKHLGRPSSASLHSGDFSLDVSNPLRATRSESKGAVPMHAHMGGARRYQGMTSRVKPIDAPPAELVRAKSNPMLLRSSSFADTLPLVSPKVLSSTARNPMLLRASSFSGKEGKAVASRRKRHPEDVIAFRRVESRNKTQFGQVMARTAGGGSTAAMLAASVVRRKHGAPSRRRRAVPRGDEGKGKGRGGGGVPPLLSEKTLSSLGSFRSAGLAGGAAGRKARRTSRRSKKRGSMAVRRVIR